MVATGIFAIIFSLILFTLIFFPVIIEEIRYSLVNHSKTDNFASVSGGKVQEITPINRDFSIVIPKIRANAKVVANVDPFDSTVYQRALTQGVAQAKGSSTPEGAGNIFLFAHSSDNWYRANRYNSVFYLLHKLEKGDEIVLYYNDFKYVYTVTGKEIIGADNTQYMKADFAPESLILSTCWPPGTTLNRLLVFAKRH